MTLWIAYATTGKELEAEEAIQAMGLDCIVPRKVEMIRRGNRRRPDVVESPFLPNYLFVWANPEEWYWLRDVKHVANIMGVSPQEERLVRAFIDRVQSDYTTRLAQIAAGERLAEYNPGDILEIMLGQFAGKTATFIAMVERAHELFPRIKADMEAMGRVVQVELDPLQARRATA